MLAKIKSTALLGLQGIPVTVEVDHSSAGMPSTDIVGLPGAAVKESKERVFRALRNSGLFVKPGKLIINLAPADIRKEGPIYDLPMAVGLLAASGAITGDTSRYFFIGELSLDGSLRPVNGVLAMCASMKAQGYDAVVLPPQNAQEACCVEGMKIVAVPNLRMLADFLDGKEEIDPCPQIKWEGVPEQKRSYTDFSLIKGQSVAKRAAEIAAAGKHNLLLIGPPGSGKTMLARALAGILPDMSFEEAMEVTMIHSVAGTLTGGDSGLVLTRPFRSPHHSASMVSLTGGGSKAKPGEISLAHNGVLFLDELPEFQKSTLEALRQPLEDGVISIVRAESRAVYPANFVLVASMNPCPCGYFGSSTHRCACTASQIQKYMARVSGPFLDRIDLHVEMDAVSFDDYSSKVSSESSKQIKARVEKARRRAQRRFSQESTSFNADMTNEQIKKYCALSDECNDVLRQVTGAFGFSARSMTRLIKVSRTIADLAGEDEILPVHIAEAAQYRAVDRKYWNYRYDS